MRAEPSLAEYHRQFEANYESLNYANNLSSRVLAHSHTLLEQPFGPECHFSAVLEVGAGSGVHVARVRHGFDTYVMTDSNLRMLDQARAKVPAGNRFAFAREDASRLSFEDRSFDRLIATHILEHLTNPHEVLREWTRVIKPGGLLSIVLPCDPGFLWRFGRNFGVKQRANAAGMEYAYWMAREHVNSIWNLVTLIEYYFDDVAATWWPSRIPAADLNLIYAANIRVR
jgi:phosphatidylethanolamine/phosphatidyl-N-methylethanolamine N-methyltransferase